MSNSRTTDEVGPDLTNTRTGRQPVGPKLTDKRVPISQMKPSAGFRCPLIRCQRSCAPTCQVRRRNGAAAARIGGWLRCGTCLQGPEATAAGRSRVPLAPPAVRLLPMVAADATRDTADVGSMCARQFRYKMTPDGTSRQGRAAKAVTGQQKTAPNGAARHSLILPRFS